MDDFNRKDPYKKNPDIFDRSVGDLAAWAF
jgi:hypothetical protein